MIAVDVWSCCSFSYSYAPPAGAGFSSTVPLPLPVVLVVSVKRCFVKLAAADLPAVRSSVHGIVPLQSPVQPRMLTPVSGTAVSVTGVAEKSAVHAEPQLMPVMFDVTMPVPLPIFVIATCATPMPDSVAESEPPGDPVTTRVAGLLPAVVGSNLTTTLQVAAAASGAVHVVDWTEYVAAVPVIEGVGTPVGTWQVFMTVHVYVAFDVVWPITTSP